MGKGNTVHIAPKVVQMEVTESTRSILELILNQLTDYNESKRTFSLNAKVAFPVCLDLAQGDAARAGELYGDLTRALTEWHQLNGSVHAKAMPFP